MEWTRIGQVITYGRGFEVAMTKWAIFNGNLLTLKLYIKYLKLRYLVDFNVCLFDSFLVHRVPRNPGCNCKIEAVSLLSPSKPSQVVLLLVSNNKQNSKVINQQYHQRRRRKFIRRANKRLTYNGAY